MCTSTSRGHAPVVWRKPLRYSLSRCFRRWVYHDWTARKASTMKRVLTALVLVLAYASSVSANPACFKRAWWLASSQGLVYGGIDFAGTTSHGLNDSVWLRKPLEGDERVLWQPSVNVHNRRSPLEQLSVSPDGDKVGFLELLPDPNVDATHIGWVLRVLSLDGAEAFLTPDVCRYSWSPDGQKIACIEGAYSDNGALFVSARTRVFSVASGERVEIPGTYRDVYWALFDGYLYLDGEEAGVFRWRHGMEQPELTAHRSVCFSPGGIYYFRCYHEHSVGYPSFDVFKREGDEMITNVDSTVISKALTDALRPEHWLSDALLLLHDDSTNEVGDYVLDVNTGQCRKPPCPIVGAVNDSTVIAVVDRGYELERLSLAECPVLTECDSSALGDGATD